MNEGLPQEIFIDDKPEGFALIALVYWDVVYMNVHCLLALSQRSIYFRSLKSGYFKAQDGTHLPTNFNISPLRSYSNR